MSGLSEAAAWNASGRLLPPQRMPLSTWIEANMQIPAHRTATPGPVRLWPFQRDIADAITDPSIERVSVLKCVRVGYSTLLMGAIANYVLNDPAELIFLLPTEKDCRDFVVSDMEPIFDTMPAVADLLVPGADEGGRSTIRHRMFPGGALKVLSGRAPGNLRRHTARILMIDEEDGFAVTQEGDALDLAIKRTLGFDDRKIIRGSTPKDADTSTICREYEVSDRRVYEFECVECHERAEPRWEQIRWEDGSPEAARWACPNCGVLIEERHKRAMVSAGGWRITRPEVKGHAGFKLNTLISPHPKAGWGLLAAEFVQIHADPDRLRGFRNTYLAEPWAEAVDSVSGDGLAARAEPFGLDEATEAGPALTLPPAVLLLTAGVDVQDDRLECTVWGWAKDGTAYALGHFVLHGSSDDAATWGHLDELLTRRWRHPISGALAGTIGIDATVVDSGDGGAVDQVYAFCWARARRGVMAGKGLWGNRPVIEASKGKIARGTLSGRGRLWIVGVDTVKASLMTRLARHPETIRFSSSLPTVWFDQLTAERRVVRRVRGKPVRQFERIGSQAAEALDCTVYAFAARQAINHVDLDAREASLRGEMPKDGGEAGAGGRSYAERLSALNRRSGEPKSWIDRPPSNWLGRNR